MSNALVNLLTLIVIGVGVFFVVMGLRVRARNAQLLATGQTAVGTIIDKRVRQTADLTLNSRYAVAQFTARDGRAYQVESAVGWALGGPKLGDAVPVIYNPAQPSEARINTFTEMQLTWLLALAFGVLFPLGWLLMLMLVRR